MPMKFDVYLAAPFFSESERRYNLTILGALEADGLKVFYPARDGVIAKDEIALGKSQDEVLQAVWECDTSGIEASLAVLAVLDGRTVDEGVCVEIGYASALKKVVVGYHTDDRSSFHWGLNPMVLKAMNALVCDLGAAIISVRELLGE